MRKRFRYRPHVSNSIKLRATGLKIMWRSHSYAGISTDNAETAARWRAAAEALGLVVFDANHIRKLANEQTRRALARRRLRREALLADDRAREAQADDDPLSP